MKDIIEKVKSRRWPLLELAFMSTLCMAPMYLLANNIGSDEVHKTIPGVVGVSLLGVYKVWKGES